MNKKQNKGTNQTHRYRGEKSGYQRERGLGRLKWAKGIKCMVTETKLQWQAHCSAEWRRNVILYTGNLYNVRCQCYLKKRNSNKTKAVLNF